MNQPSRLLQIDNLSIRFTTMDPALPDVVSGVHLTLQKEETLAIVGESGSGKTLTALSILRLLDERTTRVTGEILLCDVAVMQASRHQLNQLRGGKVGMIFQEPMSSLNPLHTIGRQLAEAITLHQAMLDKSTLRQRIKELLKQVELGALIERLDAYPHELSGGQRQRVMIAMAIANNPSLLIADEPTTALDVTVQEEILSLLKKLKNELGMSLLLITHDLGMVKRVADRVLVMQHGKIVEEGKPEDLFIRPQHAYTKQLISAMCLKPPPPFQTEETPLLKAENITVKFPEKRSFWGMNKQWNYAVKQASLSIYAGETLGIVGESGSGKTTLALALLQLQRHEGLTFLLGKPISNRSKSALRSTRAAMQMVFQDPYSSLNPRMQIGKIIAEGLAIHHPDLTKDEQSARVAEALRHVQLPDNIINRYPHAFSGGQRQRIALARALILKPKLIVMDEPTSALDVSTQQEVITLLKSLQKEHGLSYLFISHDLRVVQALAHRVIVMKEGRIVETGATHTILTSPTQPYTQKLIKAAMLEAL